MRQPAMAIGCCGALLIAVACGLSSAPAAERPGERPGAGSSLPAQLDAAQERIDQLEEALAFERKVNDELMRRQPPDAPGAGAMPREAARDELARRLDSAGRDFDSALSDLRSVLKQ